eukprot:3239436-Pleurochrysis_carterae.AAC.2
MGRCRWPRFVLMDLAAVFSGWSGEAGLVLFDELQLTQRGEERVALLPKGSDLRASTQSLRSGQGRRPRLLNGATAEGSADAYACILAQCRLCTVAINYSRSHLDEKRTVGLLSEPGVCTPHARCTNAVPSSAAAPRYSGPTAQSGVRKPPPAHHARGSCPPSTQTWPRRPSQPAPQHTERDAVVFLVRAVSSHDQARRVKASASLRLPTDMACAHGRAAPARACAQARARASGSRRGAWRALCAALPARDRAPHAPRPARHWPATTSTEGPRREANALHVRESGKRRYVSRQLGEKYASRGATRSRAVSAREQLPS